MSPLSYLPSSHSFLLLLLLPLSLHFSCHISLINYHWEAFPFIFSLPLNTHHSLLFTNQIWVDQFLWWAVICSGWSLLLYSPIIFLHSSSSQNTLQCNTRLDFSLSNSLIIGGNPTRLIVFCSLSPPLPSNSLDIFSPLLFLLLANIRTAGLFNTFFPPFRVHSTI